MAKSQNLVTLVKTGKYAFERVGLKPWSSGYGRRLVFKRLWVQNAALEGHLITLLYFKIVLFFEKNESK